MWKTVRRTLLLSALLLVAARAQNAGGSSASDVLVTMSVDVDGSFRNLQLLRGESVESAATSFARTNGLVQNRDDAAVRQVIDQLSGMLKGRIAELETTAPTVQLTLPLTVDGYSGELKKYERETTDAAVERFLYETGLTMDAMRELYPQLVTLVEQKLAELQPPQKELFSFEITIDGVEAVVRHFEGGNPVEEAIRTLQAMQISAGERMDRLVPQVANEITRQLAATAEETRTQPPAAQGEMNAEPPRRPAPTELFSIPLTLNNHAAVLVHVDSLTARESALRFLNENGITDPADVGQYLPQLVDIVDARMSEFLRDEAAQAPAAPAPAPVPTRPRELVLSLSVNLGDNRSATLEYYEGDSIERTVELFLVAVGLGESSAFSDSVAQLAGVVRQRLAAQQQERELEQQQQQQPPPPSAPLVSLPVTLSGLVYTLEYFEGEDVGVVANAFCVEKHELVRAELGLSFDGDQLQECRYVLTATLRERLASRQPEPPKPQRQPADRGDLLFTLDIDDGEGGSYQLPFHRNDNVRAVATAFCEQHNLDLANVPALEHGIQSQLAQR